MEQMEIMLEKVVQLLQERKLGRLREILDEMNPADIAVMLEEMPEAKMPVLFRILPKETAAEAFAYMDGDKQEVLIQSFNDAELKEVLDEMYVDDAVDLIEEMPASVVKRILRHTDPGIRRKINEILHYPKDSAGSLMTIEYVDLKKSMTVKEAFARIRRTGVDKETIYTCYVTDANRKLEGLVTVKTLLLADSNSIIGDIMEKNVIYVTTLEDQEEVASQFAKYDLLALPVVDKEERLVGIITIDDVVDVLQEEATEDIEIMAAITPTDKPYMKTGIWATWKKRIPWLLLLMVSATFTSTIITHYEVALASAVVLTAFIPMLMDTGGNAGSQASATIIRGLSLHEIAFRDIFKIIGKECCVAILCGLTLGIATFFKTLFLDRVGISVALVVSSTLVITVVLAKLVGCTLPMLAQKIGFDPTVMASPFITTIVDALSLFTYFQIASAVLSL